ncbi:MAG: hypothetical protein ABJC74_16405 [Gemmatimonadota bacterium]
MDSSTVTDPANRIGELLRYGWAAPTSLIGLGLAGLATLTGGHATVVAGVLEVEGGAVRHLLRHATLLQGGAAAMTLGHVVVAQDPAALAQCRSHERVHVRQAERWGPAFLPAYAIASLLAALRGGHFYRDNAFELAACREERPTAPA